MEIDEEEIRGDPYENFRKIMGTVEFLNRKDIISQDWVDEHKELILKYRQWIPDYSIVNDEVEDATFRKRCADMETLIRHLCNTINATGKFDLRIYHIFMKNMKAILEYLFAEDILEDAMNMLALK
jgi:hypothetical protein